MKNRSNSSAAAPAIAALSLLILAALILPLVSCSMINTAPDPIREPKTTTTVKSGDNVPETGDPDDEGGKETTEYRIHIPDLLGDERPSGDYEPGGDDDDDDYPDDPWFPPVIHDEKQGEPTEETLRYHASHETAKVVTGSIETENFSPWGDGAPEQLFDGDDGYFSENSTDAGNGKGTKLGGYVSDVFAITFRTNAITLGSYAFVTGNDSGRYPERSPKAWILFGSTDGENWQILDEIEDSGIDVISHGYFLYEIDESLRGEYSFYRLEFTESLAGDIQHIQLNECYLYSEIEIDIPDPPDDTETGEPETVIPDDPGRTPIRGADGEAFHNSHDVAEVIADSVEVENFKAWGDGAPGNLFDGDDGLFNKDSVEDVNGKGTKIGGGARGGNPVVTFMTTEPVRICAYAFVTGNDSANYHERSPDAWILCGSKDGKNWHVLDSVSASGIEAENNGYYGYLISSDRVGSYRYYRIEFTRNTGSDSISALQLSECYLYLENGSDDTGEPEPTGEHEPTGEPQPTVEPGGEEVIITGDQAEAFHNSHSTASVKPGSIKTENFSAWGDGAPEGLFDGDDGLFDPDSTVGDNGKGSKLGGNVNDGMFVLEFETSTPVTLTAYAFVTGNDSAKYPERNPEVWVLYGSGDGENWFVLDSVDDSQITAENNGYFGYTVDQSSARKCSHYRFVFTKTTGSGTIVNIQLSECYLYVK